MPFSSTFNNFMDKRKPNKEATGVVIDESAIVKSAAWAWYQHKSGSEGRSIREFDAWRTKIEPKPSRYKLEALRNIQKFSNLPSKVSSPSSTISTTSRASNSLLDHYEIERISRQLDYYIEASHAKYHGGDSVVEIRNKVVQRKNRGKGFWLRYRLPACGSSRNDVVENHRRYVFPRPEKGHVAVVEVGGGRPRQWGIRA